jgi:hypothetical protein
MPDDEYYARTEQYWNEFIDDYGYLTHEETQHIAELFYAALDDVNRGIRPELSDSWHDLLDYMGIHESDWNWEEFQEWYDEA